MARVWQCFTNSKSKAAFRLKSLSDSSQVKHCQHKIKKELAWLSQQHTLEELLQSVSNFIFRLIIYKHCGDTPRGVRGVKRSQILWEIEKYSLPGRPSTHHGVKSKTIIKKHQKLRKRIINQLLQTFLPPKNIFYFENWIFSTFF